MSIALLIYAYRTYAQDTSTNGRTTGVFSQVGTGSTGKGGNIRVKSGTLS